MTKRERFEVIGRVFEGLEIAERDEVLEMVAKEIAAIDNKNAKAKEKAAEKRAEGDELQARILGMMGEEPMTTNYIFASLGHEGLTPAKVVARMKNLVKNETVAKAAVKVEGRKLMAYTLA